MCGIGKKLFQVSQSRPERWTWHVLTPKWILGEKYTISSLQFTAPERLGNKEGPKMDT